MQSMLRARWLCGALVALLLVAQHGALTHALTHAGGQVSAGGHAHAEGHVADHAGAHEGDDAPADTAAGPCVIDLVCSQVLGGVHGSHVFVFGANEQVLVFAVAFAPRTVVTAVPYETRGPPAIS